eukprot:SAG11_NODE_7_length_31267_cov_19.541966_17_plen_70_part_00
MGAAARRARSLVRWSHITDESPQRSPELWVRWADTAAGREPHPHAELRARAGRHVTDVEGQCAMAHRQY